jgi:hypothetical protein
MKTFKSGEKFTIGQQDYTVVCEKVNPKNSLERVVVEHRDIHGRRRIYFFAKNELIEMGV